MKSKTDILFERRSIRKYQENKPVSDEKLKHILEAAMCAPSARNYQPWHFIITHTRQTIDTLAEVHPYGKMLKAATMAILICGDSDLEKTESYILQDCAAATQNLLLAAHGVGLGGVWLGVHPREERMDAMKKVFDLPENIIPVALISLGYPAEEKPRNDNYNQERVHIDKWNEK